MAGHPDLAMPEGEAARFPELAELNRLPEPEFANALGLLFEGAPRFSARVAAERPFASDAALLAAAARMARALPEPQQIELINAHPRLGAAPASLSPASRHEVGTANEATAAELDRLNRAYEDRFGFRYLVYVAGRSPADLVPGFRTALSQRRRAELRRAIGDTLAIAAERLKRLRAAAAEDR